MSDKLLKITGVISVGVTWVDGHILWPSDDVKFAKAYYGICHYSKKIFSMTPEDYDKPLMITTIEVSPKLKHCDHAGVCLYFDCPMNRFRKEQYYDMFKDCKAFTLSMPQDFGTKALWFNLPPYADKWQYFIIPVHGGALKHKETLKRNLK